MKKVYLLALCLAYILITNAESVSEKKALEKARQFMPGKDFSLSHTPSHARTGNAGITPYYIFNAADNAGFVIISGDDRTKAVLGYSDNGAIDVNNLPDNVEGWLGYYAETISSLGDGPITVKSEPQTAIRNNIEPLVQSTWGQGSPYNGQCVFDGDQCVTGAGATAMAQVLNYYKYPNVVAAIEGYTTSNYTTVRGLPATTLDWKNICDSYGYYDERTDAQKAAVATLMRYCGQSVQMDYAPSSSGAVTEYIASALVQYFGYAESAQMLYRSDYETDEEWENIIYQELSGKHPIVYRGRREGSGHVFIVDGYENGLYHVNWGWSGSCDGYFELSVMNATPDRVYNMNHGAIIGIYPGGATVILNKSELMIEKGNTSTLNAMVYPLTLEDKSVTWESSDTNVATVNSDGEVTGVKGGTATITCTSNATGLSATCQIKVADISLNESKVVIKKGNSVTLTPTVYPSSLTDKSVTWQSSDTEVATVTNYGLVTGVEAGTATITCTSNATGLSATCQVTVSYVKLDKSEAIINKGETATLNATVYPLALENKSVTWESSDTNVATVNSDGEVTGVKAGTATITCTSNATGLSATCKVTICYIKLDQTEAIVEKTKTLMLTPTVYPSSLTDKSITWKSSNTSVATVSSDGVVTGVEAGTATITCTSTTTGASATCKVTVGYVRLDMTEVAIAKGKTATLTPTVYPSTLENKSVTWESSNTKVATVSSSGKVKGVKAGTATITCTSVATGLSTTCKVIIGYVKLDQTEAIVEKTKTLTLTPTIYPSSLTDKSVTWKSSKTSVATVSSDGMVTGVKAGTATITCTSNATGLSTTCQVTVGYVKLDMTEVAIAKGKTATLTPTVYPSILENKNVTWESSNTKVATVSSSGKVKGVKTGTATITCTSVATGLSTTCTVTVVGVSLSKSEAYIEKTKTLTLKATISPSTFTDKSVTWKSSNTEVATVTSSGKVTGVKAGTATITCTSTATGASATCKVTVGYVKLNKTEVAITKGSTVTLTPTVYPSSLTDKSVTWKSSNTEVATVTSSGKVKGVKIGTATITCTSVATGLSTTCKVTVGKVVINMSEFTLKKSRSVTLVATVYPTTLTDKSVIWKSSNTSVATVTSSGKVKGIAAGTAIITCTSVATGLKGTCTVTVLATSESRSTEGDGDNTTGIENLENVPALAEPFDVYDLSGRKVRHQVNSLDGLPDGVYIVNGKKMLKK